MKTQLLIGLLFLCLPILLQGQKDWELQKEKNGIKIYTKNVEGSDLKAFKSSVEIDSSVETLVAVCKDVAAFPEWQEATEVAELLDNKQETVQIHYLQFPAPWPVSSRDNITQFTYIYRPSDQSVRIEFKTLPNYLPEKKDIVRIKESSGYYLFTPLANGKTKVMHSAHADPGGSIPTWLSNNVMVDTPFKTLSKLKNQVKKAKYQGKTYAFMAK